MKIEDSLKKTGGIGATGTQSRPSKGADKTAAASSTPGGTDSVKLSATGQALAQAGSSGVFDAGKVDAIKAAIADGTFKVDAEKVANGLLETVSDLIRTRKT